MRITLAVAVACLTLGGFSVAGDATAAIREETHIPAEGLGPALTKLAKMFDFQVLYRMEMVGDLKSPGAVGILTSEEALGKVLSGTGLTYQYLDDKTVTIVPTSTADFGRDASSGPFDDASASREVGKSQNFRLAQVDQGKGASVSSVVNQTSNRQGNSNGPSSELSEIVVTAQKREERLQDVPISISVLSGSALDESTSQGVMDELGRVAGVVLLPVTGASGIPSPQLAVRGVAASGTLGGGASPIGYYLDTVPFGAVRHALLPDSGSFDLERIEVLRGPQGTLYGANAEDGVVRIIPNGADLNNYDLKARVLGSYTDGGGANGGGDLAVNVPLIAGQLAVRGVIGYQDLSGWIDRPGDNHANDAQLRNYRLKIAYQPLDNLSIELSYWGSRDNFGAPSQSLPNYTALSTGTQPEPLHSDFDAYGAKISYQFSHATVTSQTSYFDLRDSGIVSLGPYDPSFVTTILGASATSRVLSEELLLNSTDTGPWHFTAGAVYRDDSDPYTQYTAPVNFAASDFTDKSRSYGIFGEVSRRFLDDRLEWTLGLRQFHDEVSTLNTDPATPPLYQAEAFNATTPRVVLSWYPNTNITVYSSFSEGFRSGFPQGPIDLQIDPNLTAVKPDRLYNYELGTKADLLNHRILIDTSVYYVKWKDVQQPITVPLPGGGEIGAVVNGQSVSGPGVDFSVTARPIDSLQVGGTISWNDLKVDSPVISGGLVLFPEGSRPDNSSQYTASLFAAYTFLVGSSGTSGALSVSGNYAAGQSAHGIGPGPTPNSQAAFVTYGENLTFVNAALTLNFQKHWSAKLYGDNLTNEYGSLISGAYPGYALSSLELTGRPRPRTVGLQLDYRYR